MEHMAQTRHLEDQVREVDLGLAAANTWELVEEEGAGHSATTLVKQDGLRVVMIAMEEGAEIPGHRVNADITVLVLRGRIRFRVREEERILERGRLLAVGRNLPHDLVAIEESEVLLTLSWRL